MDKTTRKNFHSCLLGLFSVFMLLAFPASGNCALDAGSAYFFAATGYNPSGLESIDFSLVASEEPDPQAVTIVPPLPEEVAGGVIPIRLTAPETAGIARMEFFVNGALAAESVAAPFGFSWNTSALAPGSYRVAVKGIDPDGGFVTSEDLEVAVAGDIYPPTVLLSGVSNTSTVNGTVALTAKAADNAAVDHIEIYLDGNLLAGNTLDYISYDWNSTLAANGGHLLSARAYDAAGNVGESALVTVSVLNDRTPPVVSVLSPADGSSVGGSVAVSASATDDLGVSKVEFYVDGVLHSTATSAPYGFSWDTATLSNGIHTVSAKAFDAAGNVAVSATTSVSVFYDRSAPSITSFSMPAFHNATTVPVDAFTALDNVGVTGFMITEAAAVPSASAAEWSSTPPAGFTFSGEGSRTAYAWAKDATGRVSAAFTAEVIIDTVLPVIGSMTFASGATGITVNASGTDNVKVEKMQLYLDKVLQLEAAGDALSYSWSPSVKGAQHVTVQVHDAAGNVRSRSMTLTKF